MFLEKKGLNMSEVATLNSVEYKGFRDKDVRFHQMYSSALGM